MLTNQQQFVNNRNYGRIYPLKWGYYSNPQMVMFSFTLILTISLSFVMINYVFIEMYHKIIGSLLCIYVAYRFISLGLSSPGLAIQSIDQRFQHQLETNNQFKIDTLQSNPNQQNLPQQNSQQSPNKTYQYHGLNENSLSKMGFYGYCNDCKVPIQHRTRHCKICKTCIDGYDHHCIWIGKCIGKKNMWQFKQFLCFVFITLTYGLILSIQSAKIQKIS